MGSTAIRLADGRAARFFTVTNGKKTLMALSGLVLFGFVLGHMAGNLQAFLGAEVFNGYAKGLHALPGLLWGVRLTLLAAVGIHIATALSLMSVKNAARPVAYVKKESIVSSYASRTMYWSGPILAAFIVYHLLHFTIGAPVGSAYRAPANGEFFAYQNLVNGFQQPLIAAFYLVSMSLLCLHLYHGVWSMFQTLGVNHPKYTPMLRTAAKAFAALVFVGFSALPVAVLAGVIQ
jgi:succinate dehydrogenase / fumarate reductase cytochrome b subunit